MSDLADAKRQLASDLRSIEAQVRAARKITPERLTQPGSAEAVKDVLWALWPHGYPHEVGQAGWWRTTPLGRLCAGALAQRLATSGDVPISHAVVAEIMGIQRNAVGQYVTKGYVQRFAEGEGVSLASVLARVAR